MHETRRKIYHFICQFHAEHATAPSLRDIARAVGCALTNAHYHVQRLVADGYLKATPYGQAVPASGGGRDDLALADGHGTRSGAARRARILEFVKRWEARNGCFPSYTQIAHGVGLAHASSAAFHLKKLEISGQLRRARDGRWETVGRAS
jgi:SOS-response transcriptional repressor LexA